MHCRGNDKLKNLVYRLCPRFVKKYADRIANSNIGSQIASGAFWSLVGTVFLRALNLLTAILIARILGQTVYGQYTLILSTADSFMVSASYSIALTTTKYVAELKETDPKRTGRIIGLSYISILLASVILTASLVIFSPIICNKILLAPHLVREFQIGALLLIVVALNSVQNGILVGFKAFQQIAIISIIAGITAFPIRIYFATLGTLDYALAGFGLSIVITIMAYRFFIIRQIKMNKITTSYLGAFQELPVLWSFSLPTVMSGILVAPVFWICCVMLSRTNGGWGEVAIFNAARQVQVVILFIPATISQIILPLISSKRIQNDIHQYIRTIKYNVIINITVVLVLIVPVGLCSSWIMSCYGKGFSEGYIVLLILLFASVFMVTSSIVGQIFASKGIMWLAFYFNLLWAFVLILMSFIFFRIGFKSVGLALATLIAYFLHTMWGLILLKKFITIDIKV